MPLGINAITAKMFLQTFTLHFKIYKDIKFLKQFVCILKVSLYYTVSKNTELYTECKLKNV